MQERGDERLGKCPVFEHWHYVGCTAGRREEGGQLWRGPGIRARRKSAAAVTGAEYFGKLSVACLSLENDGETQPVEPTLYRWKWRLRAPAGLGLGCQLWLW